MSSLQQGTGRHKEAPTDLAFGCGGDEESPLDMIDRLHGASRFTIRFALLMTGLMWFLSGAQISMSLFVALEPPRFPDCSTVAGGNLAGAGLPGSGPADASPRLPSQVRQLQQGCDPHVPLSPTDCMSPYLYLRPGISVVSTYNLPPASCDPRPWRNASWVHSALFAGILVGALALGAVSDSLGRRPTITFSTLGLTVVSLYSVFAPNIFFYGVARFLVGVFATGGALPSLVLLSELAAKDKRQWIVAVQAFAFCIAAVYVAVLACFVPSWRVLTLLVTFPGLFFLCGCVCCSGVYVESPRWLAARGRMEEAFSTWMRIARICRVELPDDFTLDVYTKNELQAAHDIKLRSPQEVDEELSFMSLKQIVTPDSLKTILRTFPTSVWMWVCMWLWVTCAFVYYGVLFDLKDVISEFHLVDTWEGSASLAPHPPPNVLNVSPLEAFNASKLVLPTNVTSDSPKGVVPQNPAHDLRSLLDTDIVRDMDALSKEILIRALQDVGTSSLPPENEPTGTFRDTRMLNATLDKHPEAASGQADASQDKPTSPESLDSYTTGSVSTGHAKGFSAFDLPPQIRHIGIDSDKLNSVKDLFNTVFDANHTQQYKEALQNVTQTLRNGTRLWLDSAKNIPEEAQRAVEEYEVVPKVNQFVQDVHAQFEPSDIMAPYWKNVRTEGILVVCSFATEIPAYLLAMGLASCKGVGRRNTTFSFLLCGSILLLCSWGSKFGGAPTDHKGIAVVTLIVGRCCIAAVFMLLYLYCAEIFPTSIRASSLGLLSATARIGCIFAAPLAQYLDQITTQGAMLCFGLSAFVAAILVPSTLPETLGKPLYDTLDTLEEAYQNSGYVDEFFDSKMIKVCGLVGRSTCCVGRLVRHCLAIPGDTHPTSFEAKGQQWLKEQWKKTGKTRKRWNQYKDQAQRVAYKAKRVVDTAAGRDRANFVPLHDMMDNDSPVGLPPHATVLELGEESEEQSSNDVFTS